MCDQCDAPKRYYAQFSKIPLNISEFNKNSTQKEESIDAPTKIRTAHNSVYTQFPCVPTRTSPDFSISTKKCPGARSDSDADSDHNSAILEEFPSEWPDASPDLPKTGWSFDANNVIFPNQDSLDFKDKYLDDAEIFGIKPDLIEDPPGEFVDTECRRKFGVIKINPDEEVCYYPMPCNCWKCEACARNKKLSLYHRMKNGEIKEWEIKYHFVFTCRNLEIEKDIDRHFNDTNTLLKRGVYVRKLEDQFWEDKNGKLHNVVIVVDKRDKLPTDRFIQKDVRYIWVKEFQYERYKKSNEWFRHLHVIFNKRISIYDIIPIWNHVTGVDFNYLYSRQVRAWDSGNYLLKYLTKTLFQEQFEDGERRYGCSQGVLEPIERKKSKDKWYFDRLEIIIELFQMWMLNSERFFSDFDKIVELMHFKINFIRANAMKNFTLEEFGM